jgi:cytochrome c2
MKISTIIAISVFLLLSSKTAWSEEIVFKNHGRPVKVLTLEQIEKILPATIVIVSEPHESENRRYKGFPANALFTAVYGEDWNKAEEILFTCADGYQPSMPSARFEKYPSYLVYSSPDKREFVLRNRLQNNELVELGPFYLIWDNLKHPELQAEGGSGWPYQVTTIDLISFSDRFPNMAPQKSSEEVKNGFLSFRTHCMNCHTINGEGGGKSVELNYPVSVTEYINEPWLIRWIDNPTSIRYNTTMPRLNPNAEDRETIIKNIIAYLNAMKNNKREPMTGRD